jgi:RNA polymerase sigma-70 factor (ECF subfamily)
VKNARTHPDSTHTDKDLWNLIKADSVYAFNEVYARYWDLLFHVALKRLQTKEIAEEIVQDTFIILWEKRHHIEIESLKNYLFAITRYTIFHYLARQESIAARMQEMSRSTALNKAPDIESIVNARLLLQLIDIVSNDLPEKNREVFRHNKLRDYSILQSADTFDISPKTAEGHLTKALKIIRLKLSTLYTSVF